MKVPLAFITLLLSLPVYLSSMEKEQSASGISIIPYENALHSMLISSKNKGQIVA